MRLMVESRVMMVMNALHSGGTEATCVELARRLDSEHDLEVVCLGEGGPAAEQLRELRISTQVLGDHGTRAPLRTWLRLRDLLPDFMYRAPESSGTCATMCSPGTRPAG
jgi:hypothetical protein